MVLTTALVSALVLAQVAPTSPPEASPATSEPKLDKSSEPAPNIVRNRAWIPAAIGGAFFLGGTVTIALGRNQYASAMELPADVRKGRLDQATYNTVGGVALMGLGACTLALSAVMWRWDSVTTVRVSFAPANGGGHFAISGILP